MTRHFYPVSRRSHPFFWVVGLCLVLSFLACSSSEDGSALDNEPLGPEPMDVYDDALIRQGLSQMRAHRLEAASASFAQAKGQGTKPGARATGQAGEAIVRLMLLGDQPEVRAVVDDVFVPERSGYSFERLVWQDQGILYWLSRGVRWEDDGSSLQGVRSIVSNELPFRPGRLDSVGGFVEPLGLSVSEAIAEMGKLMPFLGQLEAQLRAATDDPDFRFFYLPGDVFYASGLNTELRRSDLHMLRAALWATQAAYHFGAAYAYSSLGLDRLLLALLGPDQAIWADVLNTHLLRTLSGAQSLQSAKAATKQALKALQAGIDLGLREMVPAQNPLLDWSLLGQADRVALRGLVTTLSEVEASLDGPVTLTRLAGSPMLFDLSPAFAPGVTMPSSEPWVVSKEDDFGVFYDVVEDPLARLEPMLKLARGPGGLEDYITSLDLERVVLNTLLTRAFERYDESELSGAGF